MTLIFSHMHAVTGLFCLTDIIGSRPGTDESSVNIPIRDDTFRSPSQNRYISTLSQKCIIRGRSMFQWSGTSLNAGMIIKSILSVSRGGENVVELEKIISELDIPQGQMENESLIYHYSNNDGTVRRQWLNCVKNDPDQWDYIHSGSGVGHFFYNFQPTVLVDCADYELARYDLLSRILAHTILERTSDITLESFYGGWFEIAYREAQSFAKLPYGVKFWSFKEGVLGSGGPAYLGWYHGRTLMITRYQLKDTSLGIKGDITNTIVPDFLEMKPSGHFLDFEPQRSQMVLHIVFDEDKASSFCHIDTDPSCETFLLSVSPDGPRIQQGPAFRQKMCDMLEQGTQNSVSLNWGR